MKKLGFIFLVSLCSTFLHAQYTVRIVVNTVATKANDAIYMAGNFNDWNPADNKTKLKPFGGGRLVVVFNDVAPGILRI